MKKTILMAAAAMICVSAMAQQRPPQAPMPKYQFTTVDSVGITPVKNQKNAGTCWCYSGIGLLESELLRTKKKVYDLSEMYVVFNTYMDRAEKAVRTSGDVSFSQGGSTYDVTYAIDHFGLVPDVEMPAGVMYGETLSNHSELTAIGNPMIEAMTKGRRAYQVSPDGEPLWKKAVRAVHEVYLGKCPEKFTFEGKEYTPITFAQSLGLKSDDFVSLTSFTHEPYSTGANKGKGFAIEVQDNWRWAHSINMELDDFCAVFEAAIKAGYTINWASDVSEVGFNRQGVGVYDVEEKAEDKISSDQLRLVGGDAQAAAAADKNKEVLPKPQKVVTPAERQQMYDIHQTTDDHGMLIFGIAKDQWGNKYFMVKNSWGDASGNYKGIYYVTPEFVRAKTMNITVNKAAVPQAMRAKYGI
ncbi:MAG: aminopeptidase [Bacteroidaceae bacterium]|nr:aminopeptidase [Bacteroidaceae bacterium]